MQDNNQWGNDIVKLKFYAIDYEGNRLSAQGLREKFYIKDNWDLIDCEDNPDLVIFFSDSRDFGQLSYRITQYRKTYGFSCFIIGLTGENTNFFFPGVDYGISYQPNSDKNYYMPLCFTKIIINQLNKHRIPNSIDRQHFCNFIYSNSRTKRFKGLQDRINFCKLLNRYKRVDCAGKSLKNTDRLSEMEAKNSKSTDAKIKSRWEIKRKFMQDYKFSIAFENQQVRGYITEKILDAYLAGTIPIYWGSDNITEYFNPKSFINCHDYSSFEEVVDKVKEIDNNPQLFYQYINAPPILAQSRLYEFTEDKVAIKMDFIMGKVINNKRRFEQYRYKKVHELVGWFRFSRILFYALKYIIPRRIKMIRKSIKYALIDYLKGIRS